MFKIGSQRLTWMAVKWTGLADDGSPIENEIQCRVELVDLSELKDQVLSERETFGDTALPFALRATKDWKGVGDPDGHPLAYAAEPFTQLWQAPGFAAAWGASYLLAWNGQSGIREKNSATSPADGQAAGDTKPSPAA